MHRRFSSLNVRPGVYFALATVLALVAVFVDHGFVPSLRYSPAYFRAMAAFGVPAAVFLFLGERNARKSK